MISIAIPTYEMKTHGVDFLNFSLNKIYTQTYKDIEIIISDHSIDDGIKNLCDIWKDRLNIKYIRNENNRGSSSTNINNAMNYCTGEYIKIIFQDDYLYDENSIQNIIDCLDEDTIWLATTSEHSIDGITCYNRFLPEYNERIWSGSNSISSPSVITVKNNKKLLFDDDLIWMMDCDWYKRMYDTYGLPKILDTITVVNRTWQGRLSDTIPGDRKMREVQLMYQKYNK